MADAHDLSAYLDSCFWNDPKPLLLLNPKQPYEHTAELKRWIEQNDALLYHILFRTSGSEGRPKFVALSKQAVLSSARAVNQHLGVTLTDHWLGSLPLFHVGGFGIAARGFAAGIPVTFTGDQPWEVASFIKSCCESSATLCSLVPTQVFDLVRERAQAPPHLRAVLVGGGRLEPSTAQQARELGWPVLTTYGMTEAASQVATESLEKRTPWLRVLDGWDLKQATSGFLQLRGPALFTGSVVRTDNSQFELLNERNSEGWWTSNDQVALTRQDNHLVLQFRGRRRHLLKIKGELVNLDAVRHRLAQIAAKLGMPPRECTLVATSHERDEEALLLVVTREIADAGKLQDSYNTASPGFERVHQRIEIPAIPRAALDKIAEADLGDVLRDAFKEECR